MKDARDSPVFGSYVQGQPCGGSPHLVKKSWPEVPAWPGRFAPPVLVSVLRLSLHFRHLKCCSVHDRVALKDVSIFDQNVLDLLTCSTKVHSSLLSSSRFSSSLLSVSSLEPPEPLPALSSGRSSFSAATASLRYSSEKTAMAATMVQYHRGKIPSARDGELKDRPATATLPPRGFLRHARPSFEGAPLSHVLPLLPQ